MQPPPRKVKESQQVKLVFSEQLSRLQAKQHQDTELLEEIRSFIKHRAAIEKEYGQALQRLAIQYQKRDWQRGNTDAVSSGSVFGVWRSVVDATAQSASSRLVAAEEYRRLIQQVTASLHNAKDVWTKRGLEHLQRLQEEMVDALRELHRVKKTYYQVSHIASMAREKVTDAQTRPRKSEHGIFHFKAGLHKMISKLSARLKECDDRLTEVRNEYLLALTAVNAHHQHYSTNDLPRVMELMDGDLYDDLKSHFSLLCGTETHSCLSTHELYSQIWETVSKVTREKNVLQFLQESVSFSKTSEFTFQPAPCDQVSALQEVSAPDAEGSLVKEARKWVTKAAKDHKIITHGERALNMLESRLKLLSGEMRPSVEQKIAEVQESIRKAKLSRVKAEARVALLSETNSEIKLWFRDAMQQAEEELERERRLSEQRKSTEDFSEDEFELTDFEDYEDENGDIFTDPVSASGLCVYPAACRVLYNYQAIQSDELSITEGEELQVVEDGDVEDWLKVCNACGQVGYVPEHYVQFLCLPAEDAAQLDCSFSSTSSSSTRERSRGVARALFSYQAQSAEELSFQEGALIHLRGHGQVSALQEVSAPDAEGSLVKEARKWVTKAAKDYKIITHGERALNMLESRLKLLSGEMRPSVEQKIAEVQESIRKAKLSRVKAEARVALLSETNSEIKLWFRDAMQQAEEELERERRLSEQRKSTEDFSEDEFELTDFEDYEDENGDIFTDPVSASGLCVYPAACRVLYNYQAIQSDELSITEGEELQVVEDGDVEDWLKVCNACGQVGYVPEHYVQFLCLPAEDAAQLDCSFSSTSSSSTRERSRGVARALYSYQAQSAEELSFQEGALIHLRRYRHGQVDDGFWEGELNGRVGVFPSLVVEIVHNEEEEEEEEPLPTPTMPPFSPPIPVTSDPVCSSAVATPPSCEEDKQQVFPQRLSKDPVDGCCNPPHFPSGRLRPCRAPPPPPTREPSPSPGVRSGLSAVSKE